MNSILSAVLGAFLAALVVWLLSRTREAALRERVRAQENDAVRLANDNARLLSENSRLSAESIRLATYLKSEQAAHERLINEFKVLSADALRANRSDFLEQAKSAFAQLQQQSEGSLAQRSQAIESLVRPIRESLEKVDAKIGDIEKSRAGAYGALSEQLRALNLAQLQLQTEAARLSTALRSTTYAGSWGELQLRRVIEMADMVSYCDYVEQESSGSLRADLVVRLPGGQRIVVDAKTPLEAFRLASTAADENLRASQLAEHARKVRGHIDALAGR